MLAAGQILYFCSLCALVGGLGNGVIMAMLRILSKKKPTRMSQLF